MMAGAIVVAIDPGLTGALAWIDDSGALIAVVDMPTIAVRGGKHKVNTPVLAHLLQSHGAPACVLIEAVSAMPSLPGANGKRRGMGATSAFNFGYSAGLLEGVCAALGYPIELISPATWKRRAAVPRGKGAARLLASRTWPTAAELFKRVRDSGRAEAALLARWRVQTAGLNERNRHDVV
jgi:crossover junction endodeoxyribonuclease RuvC